MIRISLLKLCLLLLLNVNGQAQNDGNCNQNVYGTRQYIENMPDYICIPENMYIDDFVRRDTIISSNIKNIEVLAVKYNKKEENQQDGDSTFWDIYLKTKSVFEKKMSLTNIVPPYLTKTTLNYIVNNPIAEYIYENYPRRMYQKKHSFTFDGDLIILSYKYDDSYGKQFYFNFSVDENTWILKKVGYFLGELPKYWWEKDDFYYPLRNKLKLIEEKFVKVPISIEKFNLIEAFRYKEEEFNHLIEQHMSKINKNLSQSILDYNFETNCMSLPSDWKY